MRVECDTLRVPGTMYARFADGKLTGFTFTPAAADAGYFGEAFEVWHWDGECTITHEEFSNMVSDVLTISQDQKSAHFVCEWES